MPTTPKPATSFLNPTPKPNNTIKNGQQFSNCYPFHRIANDWDYCTNTAVIH
jgi:hypothetical protein